MVKCYDAAGERGGERSLARAPRDRCGGAMGRSIAFVSARGGVGKSVSCAQLAAALAVARPELTVTLLDASVHGDATHALLGGLREPDGEERAATSRGEQVAMAHGERSTARLLAALGSPAAGAAAARSWWGRRPASAINQVEIADFALLPAEVHAAGGAPRNLRVVAGGAALAALEPDEAARAGAALAALLAAEPAEHVCLIDADAELTERAATQAALAACAQVALVLSSEWSSALRALRDPINGLEADREGLPDKPVARLLFARVPKTRSERAEVAGAETFAFRPVAAAGQNVEARCARCVFCYVRRSIGALESFERRPARRAAQEIVKYLHDKARADERLGALLPAARMNDLQTFAAECVLGLPEFPETVLSHSLLHGVPIACLAPGGGVGADALAAAQEALRFAAGRLV